MKKWKTKSFQVIIIEEEISEFFEDKRCLEDPPNIQVFQIYK